ncbi:DUF4139 domain-containing protein [candidate division KSB1 bacterium]
MRKSVIFFIAMFFCHNSAHAWQQPSRDIVLYSNFAYIVERHSLQFTGGTEEFELSGFPLQIQHESIFAEDLTGSTTIYRQEYDENVFDYGRLLETRLNMPVLLTLTGNETVRGILTGISGNDILILERDVLTAVARSQVRSMSFEGITSLQSYKPVLRIYASRTQPGQSELNIHYLTNGLRWSTEYVGIYDPESRKLQLRTWARLSNNTGIDLSADKIVLVAGEPRTARQAGGRLPLMAEAAKLAQAAEPQFEQEEAHIYHKYVLNQPLAIKKSSEQQIRLFAEKEITVDEKLLFEVNRFGEGIMTIVRFTNSLDSGLGEPFPRGVIKIFQRDNDGPVFLGEDLIDNTPVGSEIDIHLGTAFDITGTRVLKEYNRYDNRRRDETIEITLKNASEEDREIEVVEYLAGQWTIIDSNFPFTVRDARTAFFIVPVPAESEVVLLYTARYN